MLALALSTIRDHLNSHMLPQSLGQTGPYIIPPGVQWTVVAPKPSFAKDLGAVFSSPLMRTHLGVIMPSGSTSEGGAATPYSRHQPRKGQLRRASVSLAIFIRSLKALPFEGQIYMYEDILVELARSIPRTEENGIQQCTLGSLQVIPEEPDYTIMEFDLSVQYTTRSIENSKIPLTGIKVGGSLLDFLVDLEGGNP